MKIDKTGLLLMFFLSATINLFSQDEEYEKSNNRLNLSFEILGEKSLPVGAKYQSDGGEYIVAIDSTNKVDGKYSLTIQSKKVPAHGLVTWSDVLFQVRGACLKSKHIRVTGYIKLENVDTSFSSAALWFHINPSINSRLLFQGNMDLRGTSDWKMYQLEFDTNDQTTWVTFGAYLSGEGKIFVDSFNIYIDGQKLSFADCNSSHNLK